jgi:P27 family predicted phage terminase small subunit
VIIMSGGRPAKPTNLKILHGDRKDRVNTAEPVPSTTDLHPPDHLSDEARSIWDRIAPDRITKGLLTPWDVDAFAAFCEALVILQLAPLEARRPVVAGAASPMSMFKDAVSICSSLGSRFGWTPSDRAKLTVREGRRDDDEDLLTG